MKYKRLTLEELGGLEKEFIRFLAINTITGDDWAKMKKENPEKAEDMIELFSDMVYEKIITELEYLEFKTKNRIHVFHCKKEEIVLMGLIAENAPSLDFTKMDRDSLLTGFQKEQEASIKLYTASKAYKNSREEELFSMLQAGHLISDGKLFETLQSLRS